MGLLSTIQTIATIASSVIIPIVIAFVGHRYTSALKQREIESKYIELCMTILKEDPTVENARVRRWAVKVVNLYSPIKLNEKDEEEILAYKIQSDIQQREHENIMSIWRGIDGRN